MKLTNFATGIGSVPEMSTATAARWVADYFPSLPHIAEVPARGPWSSMIGRSGALLSGLSLDLTPHGFRIVSTAGNDQRKIDAAFRADVDAMQEVNVGHSTSIKTQVVGPWTLASQLETTTARRVLQDPGACRDIAQSLADGLAEHVEALKRMGFGDVVVQIDEPSISGIRRGAGATLFSQPRVPEDEEIVGAWNSLRARIPEPMILHSCASDLPWHLLAEFDAVSVDAAMAHDEEKVAGWLDAGRPLWWGAVAVSDQPLPELSTSVESVRSTFKRLGFGDRLRDRIAITAACGFAGISRPQAESIAKRLADLSRSFAEEE